MQSQMPCKTPGTAKLENLIQFGCFCGIRALNVTRQLENEGY